MALASHHDNSAKAARREVTTTDGVAYIRRRHLRRTGVLAIAVPAPFTIGSLLSPGSLAFPDSNGTAALYSYYALPKWAAEVLLLLRGLRSAARRDGTQSTPT
ncbi:hypothetical protein ACWGJ2_21075 [Streptomyces sp. NPDC054796]